MSTRAFGRARRLPGAPAASNTAAAEAIKQLADELEKAAAGDFNKVLTEALRSRIKAHKKVE